MAFPSPCPPAARAVVTLVLVLVPTMHPSAQRPRITPEQLRALGRDLVLPGGIYRIRPVHSKHCLAELRTFGPVVPHLVQVSCTGARRFQEWIVLPDPARGYTIRLGRAANGCATTARNVILGPKAIDFYPCQGPVSASCAVGTHDQIFQFLRRESGSFAIVPSPGGALDGCFDVREASQSGGAEVILYDCNGETHQRFLMEFLRPITDSDLLACAQRAGWRPAPDGLRRAVPVQGVDLPGADYDSAATVDDGGVECQQRCLDDTRCRAWTWARREDETPAMCWLKNDVPLPERNDSTSAGIVRP